MARGVLREMRGLPNHHSRGRDRGPLQRSDSPARVLAAPAGSFGTVLECPSLKRKFRIRSAAPQIYSRRSSVTQLSPRGAADGPGLQPLSRAGAFLPRRVWKMSEVRRRYTCPICQLRFVVVFRRGGPTRARRGPNGLPASARRPRAARRWARARLSGSHRDPRSTDQVSGPACRAEPVNDIETPRST